MSFPLRRCGSSGRLLGDGVPLAYRPLENGRPLILPGFPLGCAFVGYRSLVRLSCVEWGDTPIVKKVQLETVSHGRNESCIRCPLGLLHALGNQQ